MPDKAAGWPVAARVSASATSPFPEFDALIFNARCRRGGRGCMTETSLVRTLLRYASRHGGRWFRNNVGILKDIHGNRVAFGLCVGSSDVIGWTPVVITPEMVGRTVAVFTAFECKQGRRVTTVEQGAFVAAVKAQGGIAAVVRQESDTDAAIERFTHE